MTRKQIERRLKTLGLRLEKDGNGWIVRPDTLGSCHYGQVTELKSLREAAILVDMKEAQADRLEWIWQRVGA